MFDVLLQVIGALILVMAGLFIPAFMGVYSTVNPYEIRGNYGRRKRFFERLVDTCKEIWG